MIEFLFFLLIVAVVIGNVRVMVRHRRFKKAGIQDPHPWSGWGAAPKPPKKTK